VNTLASKKIYGNMISLFIVQVFNYLSPILVLPFLSRVLGVDKFGVVMINMSLSMMFLVVSDYGFGLLASYKIAKLGEDKIKISNLFSSIITIKIFLFLLCFIAYFFYFEINKLSLSLFVFFSINLFFQSFQFIWFFQGIEKMKYATLSIVTSKVIYAVSIFILVTDESRYSYVFLSLSISSFFALLLSCYFYFTNGYRLVIPDIRVTLSIFKDSTPFFFSRAAVNVYTTASTFILGQFSGVKEAALYSGAEKIYQAGQSLTQPFTQAIYPYLARSNDTKYLFKALALIFPFYLIGVMIVYYFSDYIINLFYGPNFNDSIYILHVFLLSSLVTFLSVNLGYPAYSIYGRLDLVNNSVYIASVLQAFSLFFLFEKEMLSGRNVAISILFIEIFVLVFRTVFLIKIMRHK